MPPHDETGTRLALLEHAVSDLQADNERLRGDLRAEQDARLKRESESAGAASASIRHRGSISWWLSVIIGAAAVWTVLSRFAEWAHLVPAAPKVP